MKNVEGYRKMRALILAMLIAAIIASGASMAIGPEDLIAGKDDDGGDVGRQEEIDWANLKPETVLNAISILEIDPTGKKAAAAMAVVMNFTEASENVLVILNSGYFPWLDRKAKPDLADGQLLAAFVAGNVRPQLQKQVNKDHAAEGLDFMLRTYAKLRAKKLVKKIPECEKWSKLDMAGLRKLVIEIRGKENDQPDAP